MQDYSQPLERYDNYEDDEGELRAESNLAEKFGESPLKCVERSLSLRGTCIWLTESDSQEAPLIYCRQEQTTRCGLITVLRAPRLLGTL